MTTIREQLSTDVASYRKPIKSLEAATYTASVVESGTMYVLNRAAGVVVTLPATADVGTYFDVMVGTTLTSNLYQIITAVGTELLVGKIVRAATDDSNATLAYPALVGSNYVSVDMDGSTRGGIKGDSIRFTKINATTWLVYGNINATGVVATPFSAAA
jgi:hypothetical protein